MIRHATTSDLADCVELFEHLIESHPMAGLMGGSRADLGALLLRCMESGTVLVAEAHTDNREQALTWGRIPLIGMLAIFATHHHLSGIAIGHEIAFWVEPEHRKGAVGAKLLHAAEEWACKKSIAVLQIMSPVRSDLGKFYTRAGYEEVETVFLKRL